MTIDAAAPHTAMNSVGIAISGMTGDVCVFKVRHALMGVLGVRSANVVVGSAIVAYDAALANDTKLRNAIRAAGFVPSAG